MATWSQKDNLVVDTIRDNRTLAEEQTLNVKDALERQLAIVDELPLTVVDPQIGTNLSIAWTATIPSPGAITEPTFLQTIIDSLPTTAPVIPTVTLTIDDFTETPPDAVTGTFTGNVLGQSYWDALYAAEDAKITLEMAARLRMSRNRGAASWMPMPTEAVSVGSRQVTLDAMRARQEARARIFMEQAKQGREDFWDARKLDITRYQAMGQIYSVTTDARIKAAQFPLETAKLETEVYKTQFETLTPAATGTKAVIDGRVAIQDLNIRAGAAQAEFDKWKNEIEVETGKLDQAAQESLAKIDVAQSQWINGQRAALLTSMTQTASGMATAALSASNVGLSSSLDMGIRHSVSASENQDREWIFVMDSGE